LRLAEKDQTHQMDPFRGTDGTITNPQIRGDQSF
jgi:hypothetical protein